MDFQRVDESVPIRVRVPVHLIGAEVAPGVKTGGGMMIHEVVEVELEVLPRHLPAFIELDVSAMEIGDALRLSDLTLPETGSLVELGRGEDHDQPIVVLHAPRGGGDEDDEEAEAESGDAEAAGGES
jgi:large subunit ribosomal protein L25